MPIPRWLWIPAALQGALGIALCFVPLFDLLAYEFALAVGIVAVPTGLAVGMGAGKHFPRAPLAILGTWGAAALHLMGPLLFISLNTLRVRNCDYWEGLGFFALLPLCTSLYASTLGLTIARVLSHTGRTARVVAVILLALGPLAATLWTLYNEPPIFAFDHLWGHFAGSLYDEVIRIDSRLIVFRLGTLLRVALLAIFIAAWDRRGRLGQLRFAAMGAVILLAASLFETSLGGPFGFRVRRSHIEEALPDRIDAGNIVIHLPAKVEPKLRQRIVDDHVFRLEQLCQRLGVVLEHPIHSYVYANAAAKARLMGGHNTQIAKPWLHEIHIHNLVSPHPVLAHELAHAVAASFGSPPFGVSSRYGVLVNMGLVEGLAEAVTLERGDLELDHWAKALRELELAPDIRTLLGPAGFWRQAPRRAYTIAGSFVRFLLRNHGPEALRQLYAHGDFEGAYGVALDDLVSQWESALDAIELSEPELALARAHFDRPSIFHRTCAHEVAQLRRQADDAAPEDAIPVYELICTHVGHTPGCQIDLAFAHLRAGADEEFRGHIGRLLDDERLHPVQRTRLIEARGNLAWKQGDIETAREDFETVAQARLDPSSQRLQWVRLWALTQPEPLREDLRLFLSAELPPLAAVLVMQDAAHTAKDDTTLPYLIARQLIGVGEYRRAQLFLNTTPHPFPPIEAERVRLLADAAWNLGDFEGAQAGYIAYGNLAPTSAERMRSADWVERIRWQSERAHTSGADGTTH